MSHQLSLCNKEILDLLKNFQQKTSVVSLTIQFKSKESHAQQTEISDIHEHCIPINIPYFISSWW